MKTIFLISLLGLLPIFAQQPHALTDAEQQQWAQFAAREKAASDALTAAVNDLLNTPTGESSVIVHSHYQTAWLALRLVQTERAAWLGNLRAAKGCKDCAVSGDGRSLEKPEAVK